MILLTQAEAAEMLRCSVSTVARLRREGDLAYIPGRPVRLRKEDVDRWIARHALRRTKAGIGKSAGQSETPRGSPGPEPRALGKRIALLRKR